MAKKLLSLIVGGVFLVGLSIFITREFFLKKNLVSSQNFPINDKLGRLSDGNYNKDGLRITSQEIGADYTDNSITRIPEDQKNTDHYINIEIYDNGKPPLGIIFPVFDESPEVQIVNDKYVVLQIIDERGGIHFGYVINRETRKITHYLSEQLGGYLTTTNDAQKIIFYNYLKKQIIVTDSQLKETRHLNFSDLANVLRGAAISPDDSRVAFFAWNGDMENEVYHAFIYNIASNTVQNVGTLTDAEQAIWKDNSSFVNTTQKFVGNQNVVEEKERFVVNP